MINWKDIKKTNDKKNLYADLKPFIKKDEYSKKTELIKVENLSYKFKNKVIYNGINFEIFENEKLGFLGPNGAGKTLTISTICGFMKPNNGSINYLFDYDTSPFEKLSVQFQDLKFPTSLTPKDLIDFTIKLTNSENYWDEIKEGIEAFEIDKILNTKISKLSGGQQQRINVFIAMIGRPKILFLDEFTTGLDISIKNKLQNYIMEFCNKNKITLVIISHDIDCIEDMVDRIIILADQRIMVDAQTKDIKNEFGSVKKMLKKYIIT